jgi:hypothetical protein
MNHTISTIRILYFLLVFSIFIPIQFAYGQRNSAQTTGVILASDFHVTKPLREIFAEHPVDETTPYQNEESEDREHRKPQKFRFSVKDGPQFGNEEKSIQKTMGDVPPLPIRANWAGQSASGFRPFDPSGAVGPNHYVQMINSTTFKVYNKTSGVVLLTATLGNLWSPATANAGDPIVLYDKAADRWFLAQFGSANQIYIAISQSNDPTGSYYTYTYTSPQFPDYLKFSVWSDGYYMTSNQGTQKVFSFNRAELLAGTPGARSIYVNFTPPNAGFFAPLPGDAADGTMPPTGTPCPIFSYSDNGWGTGYSDAVNIYQMSVNWVPTTPTASITLSGNLPTAAFDASYDANWNDCPQPNTTQKLDGIGGVCMYRAQFKSWTGYNTVVLNWGVKSSSTQRSIKWCELRQNQTTNTWSIYQEGIYRPDTTATRWMGSIAMDNNGSIGLSYIKSDPISIYPGIYYTGRRSCDPLGTLPVIETIVIAGTGSQTGTNRVGDYSHTTLDTDGITFWNTSEYMGGTTGGSAAKTRIFSYQIAPCSNPASVTIAITSGSNPQCAGASATFTATPINGGSAPIYQWQVNGINVGTNNPVYTSSSLTNGQVVTCIMTSNLSGVIGSPATSNAITMTVNAITTSSVSIALTGGSNPACAGAALTFTATPSNGGTPVYQWQVNGVNVGTNSSTYSTSTLTNGQIITCTMTSSVSCASPVTATSNAITIYINPNITPSVSIALTGGSNPACAGAALTFTATPSNGGTPVYQWKVNGVNVGTNSSTYSTSTLTNGQIITCTMTSSLNCASPVTATSNAITMTINPNVTPSVSIALTGGSNPACAGAALTFTATPSNGGTPVYQWKVNGVNVGINSSQYSSSTLSTGDSITCLLTSTASCVSAASVTSNSIVITINPLPNVTIGNVSGCSGIPLTLIGNPSGGTFSVANPYLGASTTYSYSYTNTNGCTVTTSAANITIHTASTNQAQSATACNTYTWPVNNQTYTSSGNKIASFINVWGCDSSYTLNLTMLSSSSSTNAISANNNYTWAVNGNTYTSSGVYTASAINYQGCDSIITLNLTITIQNLGLSISPKVMLAGPYNTALGLMSDSLRTNNLLPATEPYSTAPLNFPQISYPGGETVSQSILSINGNDAIVDWIFLELRSAINPTIIVATKRALLQRDGDIVSATDGISPILFPNQVNGNYYLSVKHRNHLGVMTASPLTLSSTTTSINFSNEAPVWINPLIQNPPRKTDGIVRLLYVGDANTNKNVKYNGTSNDKDRVLNTVGTMSPNNIVTGYRIEDVNMDSKVKYNSTDNDRTIILNSVGSSTPNTILFQHTPN